MQTIPGILVIVSLSALLAACGDEGGSVGAMGADRQREATVPMPDPHADATPTTSPLPNRPVEQDRPAADLPKDHP